MKFIAIQHLSVFIILGGMKLVFLHFKHASKNTVKSADFRSFSAFRRVIRT